MPLVSSSLRSSNAHLVHESGEGGEAAVHDELYITKLTGRQLDLLSGLGNGARHILGHEVNELAAVGLGK